MKRAALALAVMLTLTGADAQTVKQAKTFVGSIYSSYRSGDPDLFGKGGDAIFTPALLKSIQADKQGAQTLNYDPFCECSDPHKVRFGGVSVDLQTSDVALAQVDILTKDGERTRLRLVLLWTNAGWRVDDISTKQTPSLRKVIAQPQ